MNKTASMMFAAIGLAVGLAGHQVHATTVLQVNLGPAGLPTETGFDTWTTGDRSTPGPTTINGIDLSFIASTNDGNANQVRSLNRGGDDGYNGPLANLTQAWWGVRAGPSTPGGFLTLAIDGGGIGSSAYDFVSWHHDHADQTGVMDIEVSVDGGQTFTQVVNDLDIVDGNTDGHTGAPNPVTFGFVSNGTDDVHIRFTNDQTVGTTSSNSFVLVNGFSLTQVPEPGSLALLSLGGLCLVRRRRR